MNGAGSSWWQTPSIHTIRALTISGTNCAVTTVGGTPGQAGNADGGGSAARFSQPHGITVNSTGHLVVADTLNHTIRVGMPGVLLQGG